jgi:diadenosine tetraphosphate (Ap4A) HIT family hydrolase
MPDDCVFCNREGLRELAEVYVEQELPHAHFHVIPRFDTEPLAGAGGRSAIKVAENRRPDPLAPGAGRARSFGRR